MQQPPEEVYHERIARFKGEFDVLNRRWESIANLRLYAFVLAALAVVAGIWQDWPALWVVGIVLFVAFLVLVWLHHRVGRQRRRYEELFRINDEAVKRLHRRWDELPLRHEVPETDPRGEAYARDLDIFGHASLFQLLETTGTFMGEEALASWLLAPASPEAVRSRQEAVRELAPMIDLRDELYLRGRLMGADEKPDPGPFLAWAEDEPWLEKRPWIRWGSYAALALMWGLALAQIFGLILYPLWSIVAAALAAFTLTIGRQVHNTIARAEVGEQGFKQYASAFEILCEAPFQAPELKRLQSQLSTGGVPAPAALRGLHRIMSFTLPDTTLLYLVVEVATLWEVHHLRVLERWQQEKGRHAREWLQTLGEAEALSSLAALSFSQPGWAFPEVDRKAVCLEAQALGHPLLPNEVRVDNDVTVGPPGSFLLVTGSNMSGKSTLLRAMGVNIVLAQSGGPVCAASMRAPSVSLWTSMRVEDSLERGVSFFMAELQRLKQVVDASQDVKKDGDRRRLFYLLDEVLQGTNTAERQIAARRVIGYLVSQGAIGAVSTHDLTLADAPETAAIARPVHFTESIIDTTTGPQMVFDYKLRPGIATSTNALKLMEIVGLDLGERN